MSSYTLDGVHTFGIYASVVEMRKGATYSVNCWIDCVCLCDGGVAGSAGRDTSRVGRYLLGNLLQGCRLLQQPQRNLNSRPGENLVTDEGKCWCWCTVSATAMLFSSKSHVMRMVNIHAEQICSLIATAIRSLLIGIQVSHADPHLCNKILK